MRTATEYCYGHVTWLVEYREMDWIELAQGKNRWRTLVNALWTFGFHKFREIS